MTIKSTAPLFFPAFAATVICVYHANLGVIWYLHQ